MGIRITPETGCWIRYQLDLRDITHKDVARTIGCTREMVTQFLRARKGSARVEKALADILGYRDFTVLVASSRRETI